MQWNCEQVSFETSPKKIANAFRFTMMMNAQNLRRSEAWILNRGELAPTPLDDASSPSAGPTFAESLDPVDGSIVELSGTNSREWVSIRKLSSGQLLIERSLRSTIQSSGKTKHISLARPPFFTATEYDLCDAAIIR